MKSKTPVIFIFICLFYLPVLAQTTNDTTTLKKDMPVDSSYIKYYDQYLNVTAGWNTRNTKYTVSYPQYNIRFVLSPRETNQFNISLDYSFLYLYYSFTPHVFNLNSEDTIKGSSKRSTFGTGFSFKRCYINFDYQNIKGYYLQNTNEFKQGWVKGDAYLQFPDLRTIQTGLQAGYNFNKRFSVSGLTSGKEQQLKTVVTFFPILAYWNIKMKAETDDSVQKSSNVLTINNDINLLLPASASIVFAKNFYIAASAGPIIGIDFFRADAYDQNGKALITSGTKISTGYYARASIGYTSKKFFTGIDAFSRNYEHQQQDQKFSKYSYGVQVYIGTRFDPPVFLQKADTWLQKMNPF
jgi:Domain of unknown function (DUF4421)